MSLPVQLALLLFAAVVVVAVLFLRRRPDTGSVAKLLPSDEQIGALRQERMLALRRSLAIRIEQIVKSRPKHETELLHHGLWHAMLLMANADQEVDEEEIAFVVKLYGELVTTEPVRSHVYKAIQLAGKDRISALFEIAKARTVDDQAKTIIVQGAYLVGLANNRLETEETALLHEIIETLQLDEGMLGNVFDL